MNKVLPFPPIPPKRAAVARVAWNVTPDSSAGVMVVYLNRTLTRDEKAYLQEVVERAVTCMPEF